MSRFQGIRRELGIGCITFAAGLHHWVQPESLWRFKFSNPTQNTQYSEFVPEAVERWCQIWGIENCFPKAIALCEALRLTGVEAFVLVGMTSQNGWHGHAWVETQDRDFLRLEEPLTVVQRFPSERT